MDGTIEGLPCLQLPEDRTRRLGDHTAQHGGRKHSPGNHPGERHTALQPCSRCSLPGFDATAAFEHALPAFPPATRLPVQALQGLGDGVDRTRGQPQPLAGVRPGRGHAHEAKHEQPPQIQWIRVVGSSSPAIFVRWVVFFATPWPLDVLRWHRPSGESGAVRTRTERLLASTDQPRPGNAGQVPHTQCTLFLQP